MGHLVDGKGHAYAAPSQALDVEVELGFFVGIGSFRFERIKMEDAADHIFGAVMLNDWSSECKLSVILMPCNRPELHIVWICIH